MDKVFILGNPRSGTSLLRIMLNSHPNIVAPPECGFMQWLYKRYKYWSVNSLHSNEINQFIKDLFNCRKIEAWDLNSESLFKFLLENKPNNYSNLIELIYLFWGKKSGRVPEVIVDKNNYYIHYLNTINSVWPDAKHIHIVRDGRDVACSYKQMKKIDTTSPYKPNLPNEIDLIANEWLENNYKILNFLNSKKTSRSLTVKFEDLIFSTKKELNRICNFLEISFSKQMLVYYKENKKNNMEPSSTIDWKLKTLESPDTSKIGRYKNDLTKDEIFIFNKIAHEMIDYFSYK